MVMVVALLVSLRLTLTVILLKSPLIVQDVEMVKAMLENNVMMVIEIALMVVVLFVSWKMALNATHCSLHFVWK